MASNNLFDFSVVLIDTQGLIRCVISDHICSHSRQSLNQISTNVSVLVWMLDLVDLGDEGSPAQRVCVFISCHCISHLLCYPRVHLKAHSDLMWITVCTAPPAGCVCICHTSWMWWLFSETSNPDYSASLSFTAQKCPGL